MSQVKQQILASLSQLRQQSLEGILLPPDVTASFEAMMTNMEPRNWYLLGMLCLDQGLPLRGSWTALDHAASEAFGRLVVAVQEEYGETSNG